MNQTLGAAEVIQALAKMAVDLTAAAEQLRELDAAIGDGDLGITVTIGFQAVRDELLQLQDSDVSTILLKSGMAFNRKAASTFGVLFATMMMRAARVSKGSDELGVQQLAEMLDAAAQGVRDRGKSSVGDKTMLDALVPAAEALTAATQEGLGLAAALARTADAAEEGMRATIALKSKIGRSSWFADRTQGVQDPGATAIYLMLRSLCDFVAEGSAH